MAVITGTVLAGASLAYGVYSGERANRQQQRAIDNADPFRNERPGYAAQLASLMQDPTSFTQNDPGYKFQLEEGLQAAQRSGAAQGFLGSGNMAIELMRYAQGFSTDYLDKQKRLLAELAGAGIAPNAGAGVQGAQNTFDRTQANLASLGRFAGLAGDAYSSWQNSRLQPVTITGAAATRMPVAGYGGVSSQ